jgi:hypothetical protein
MILHTVTIAAWTECCSAHGVDERGHDMSLTTYDRLPQFLEAHAGDLVVGAWIADLVPLAGVDGLARLAWNCPLPNVKITDKVEDPTPYDYVSPRQWAEYWHEHGGRVGRWQDGTIHWFVGTVLPDA